MLTSSAVRRAAANAAAERKIVVIGAGLMGSGIAQVAAQNGFQVTLVDQTQAALDKGQSGIQKSLDRIAKKKFDQAPGEGQKWTQEVLGRIALSSNAQSAVKGSDLVIEAIVENLQVKRSLFQQLDASAPAKTLFASNTSSIPIGQIASSTKRADRFGGLHFFNPVPQMKLCEVIRTDQTSDETFAQLIATAEQMKKSAVKCKDTPGFIVNRLLVPYILEAFRMAERKEASTQDIDTAMKLGAGYPMGPFELADFVGLDTLKFITDGWNHSSSLSGSPLAQPIPMLDRLVKEGRLGRKSGKGVYDYTAAAPPKKK